MRFPPGRKALIIICILLTAILLSTFVGWPTILQKRQFQNLGSDKTPKISKPQGTKVQISKSPSVPKIPGAVTTRKEAATLFITPLMTKDLDYASWTLDSLRYLYFTEVLRVHRKCSKVVRVGRQGDGGWDICMDKGYELKQPCLVYSFGVGNIWEFDEQMAIKYNCTVRAFDPTMGKKEHVHKPGPVHFYPIGLGGNADAKKPGSGFQTLSLFNFIRKFKEKQFVVDVLKIDVEYYEWGALERMMKDGSLGQVKQLMLESHTNEVRKHPSDIRHYRRYLKIMQTLEVTGFRKYKATKNKGAIHVFRKALPHQERNKKEHRGRSCCYELYYINTAYRATEKRR